MRTSFTCALAVAALAVSAGGAFAAQGNGAYGTAPNFTSAYSGGSDASSGAANGSYATSESSGHRHVDSSWMTAHPNPLMIPSDGNSASGAN